MIKDCNLKTAENRHPAKNGRENRAQTDQWDSERGETIAARRVEHHADAILRAAGSGLRHYSMAATRRAILSAAMEAYEESYRAGAAFADASYRAGEVGK